MTEKQIKLKTYQHYRDSNVILLVLFFWLSQWWSLVEVVVAEGIP